MKRSKLAEGKLEKTEKQSKPQVKVTKCLKKRMVSVFQKCLLPFSFIYSKDV